MAKESISIKYQRKTARISLWGSIGAVLIGIFSVVAAICIPIHQHDQQVQSELSALYRTIDANGNIFVGSVNNMRAFEASDTIANLPDAYIEYAIPNELHQLLQEQLGMVNYAFLLYYMEETKFLNQMRDELNTSLIAGGATSPAYKNAKRTYVATMNYLAADGWDETKFNYQMDAGCLLYLLQRSFDSISLNAFDKGQTCSTNSLNRIFYWFGYLPPITPDWMRPLLRNALNQKQAGLGDRLIQMNAQ